MADKPDRVACLIVGLGPVGATLANLMGLAGIETLAVDRAPAPYDLPRAVHFDDEVMRVFQTIGVASALEPLVRFNPGMRFVAPDGGVLLDWPRQRAVTPQGWLSSYRFHQPDLETVLRRRLADWPSVRVETGVDAVALEGPVTAPVVRLRNKDGAERRVAAEMVIGCDGARSAVRAWLGGGHEDLGFSERWLVVDAILKRPQPELGDVTLQFCDAEAPATYVRCPGDRRRWEIFLGPEGEPDLSPDAIAQRLSRWIAPDDCVIERAAVYTFRSRLARTWQRGRIAIAGDAAHESPPFMGQGMCAGIRDVANLGWKVTAVLEGAPERLLGTYQSERAPHVLSYIRKATELGRLINVTAPDAALETGDRNATGAARMTSLDLRLGPGLWRDDDLEAGGLAPQPVLRDGMRLDDAIGANAVLLAPAPLLQDTKVRAALARPGSPLAAAGDVGAATLIRPDRYVFGSAQTAGSVAALLDDWMEGLRT